MIHSINKIFEHLIRHELNFDKGIFESTSCVPKENKGLIIEENKRKHFTKKYHFLLAT